MCFFKTYKKDEMAPNLGNIFKGTKKFFGILKNDARTIDDIYVDNSPKNAQLIKGMLDANAQTPEKVLGEEDCNMVSNVSFQYQNSTIATAYEQASTDQAQAESSVKESLKALIEVAKHLPVVSTIISVSNVLLECRKAEENSKEKY